MSLQEFRNGYIDCALWSTLDESRDDGGDPLENSCGAGDIDPETMAAIERDCDSFYAKHGGDSGFFDDACAQADGPDRNGDWITADMRAGHDFWLTRNGHGAGFWDGDWNDPHGDALTESAKSYGEVDLYIGDDGSLYHA